VVNQAKRTVQMIVIGADTHKRTHALAAVEAGTGRQPGERQIKAEEPGHLAAVRWARGLDDERVWAIEDCRASRANSSRRCSRPASGWCGCRLTGWAPPGAGSASRASRTRSTRLRSPRAVVKDGPERFPAAYLDEEAMEIRLLSDHRKDLVAERTRAQSRLRWHLLELCPDLERVT
jgi:transposase